MRILFQDGDHKCSYLPPPGWTYYGTKDRLSLEANDRGRSHAAIGQVLLKTPAGFDQVMIDALEKEMIQELPKEIQDVKIMGVEKNPFVIDNHETLEIKISYSFLGLDRMKSILFIDLGGSQLRFTLSSLKSDFENTHELFRRSYYSWQWCN